MSDKYTPDTLTPELKAAVIDLLYRLADDSIVIGHRNSEWTGIGPILEEDIAFSSTAQDKMGHALAFYNLLHELGEPKPDDLAFLRDAKDFRCCSFVAMSHLPANAEGDVPELMNNPTRNRLIVHGDWSISLMRQFLFVEADVLRMHALESSTYQPLAAIARKIRGELKYHLMHAESMLRHLATGTDESRKRMQQALNSVYPHALGLFEPTQHDKTLANAGIAPGETHLRDEWIEHITPLLAGAGLRQPTDVEPVFGGRKGRHGDELVALLADMQKIYRMEPTGTW
ncbi:MAG: phenylacetate-CoA oxygenase subunit PaaC [Phycisphaerales bacterium]|nr:phenylacetate-CoA oxygenase subunit PaaC [Phycisphaerales bacterium]